MKTIEPRDFVVRINDLWKNKWFLLTSGDFKKNHFNTMTVAWGYFGIMWNKPMAVVVVRPVRYTFDFINNYDSFTLSAFGRKHQRDLVLLGTRSGRDGNKLQETALTACPSKTVDAPSFEEAELVVECQKVYWDDFKPEQFVDHSIEKNYPQKDYHRMFFGEIMQISGIGSYCAR